MTKKPSDGPTGRSARWMTSSALVLALACGGGTALGQSSGDFNGDGYADLAIGVPWERGSTSDTVFGAGAVQVLYGSADGLTEVGDVSFDQGDARNPGLAGEAESYDLFGTAIAVGDFDGDGFDDLAIGVPKEDTDSAFDSGAVNVVYGSAVGLTLARNQYWDEDVPGVKGTAESGDKFGFSLAAGDFNGDGADDLAVGVFGQHLYEPFTAYRPGAVHVFYGQSSIGLTANDQVWHQNSPGLKGVADYLDYFGWALAAADFDADGRDDLAIGIPYEEVGDVRECGAVQVLYGTSSGLSEARDQLWDQGSSGVPGARESGDLFGHALAAGDLNGDGAADLAVGVPGENDEAAGTDNSGAVNVFYGVPGLGLGTESAQILAQPLNSLGYLESGDEFGRSLAIGRLTPDIYADLIVGVPGEENSQGAVNVFTGRATTVRERSFLRARVLGGASADDRFGYSLTIGDFDGDGVNDVAFGVPFDDISSASGASITDAGSVTVLGRSWTYWTQETAGVSGTARNFEQFGGSLGR